jgi:hypothetical protein
MAQLKRTHIAIIFIVGVIVLAAIIIPIAIVATRSSSSDATSDRR